MKTPEAPTVTKLLDHQYVDSEKEEGQVTVRQRYGNDIARAETTITQQQDKGVSITQR